MEEVAASALVATLSPTHTEIIERLLRASIGSELHSGSNYFTVADVYSAAPYHLVAQHAQPASSGTGDGGHGAPYYFLSPVHHVSATRKSRTVAGTDGNGRWHTEAGRKLVQGSAGVYMSKFSYKEKTSSGTTMPAGWLMVEYGIDGCDTVIAKIYRSHRRPALNASGIASTSASSTSTLNASGTASSSSTSTWSLHEIERFLMSDDDAEDLVESQQAVLAHYGAPQFLAGQYNVSGAAAAVDIVPQFLAGQYNISAAAAPGPGQAGAAHYLAGEHHVAAAAAAAAAAAPPGPGQTTTMPSWTSSYPGHYLAGEHHVAAAAAAAAPGPGQAGAAHYLAGEHHVAAAVDGGVPQFLAGQYNISAAAAAPGPGQAGAAHYLAGEHHVAAAAAAAAAALQVWPGHADHANMVVLGHNQTVLGAGYEVQAQAAQHLIPEPAIVGKLADDVVIQPHVASTSGGLPNHLEVDHLFWNYGNTYFG